MLTHTACASCGETLVLEPHVIVRPGYISHARCPEPADHASVLTREFLAAALADDNDRADQLAAQLDSLADQPPNMPAAARAYAAWGWPIFPLKPGLKIPVVKHGFKAATTDVDKIDDWWWRWPHAGIGVATGWMFDVIDLDGAGGFRWLASHRDTDGVLPDVHACVSTPRGQHLYIKPTGTHNLAGFAPGVDYRGKGGYVILPPTRLVGAAYVGKELPMSLRYSWAIYPSPAIKRKGA